MSYRGEAFKTANALKNNYSEKVGEIVFKNKMTTSGIINNVLRNNKKQFYGFLYVNSLNDELKSKLSLTTLRAEEENLLAELHDYLVNFVDDCLEDIKTKSIVLYEIINPYSDAAVVKVSKHKLDIDRNLYFDVVKEYKKTNIYLSICNNKQMIDLINGVGKENANKLMSAVENEMRESMKGDLTASIDSLSKISFRSEVTKADEIIAYFVLLLSARLMLENVLNVLYSALIGDDLVKFNENNITNLSNNSNMVYNTYKINIINSIEIIRKTSAIGNVGLIYINQKENVFGIIQSINTEFSQKYGLNERITMHKVDDEFNMFSGFTEYLIKSLWKKTHKEDVSNR